MCRHLAYVGPPVPLARLLTEPPRGLYEQSWHPRRQTHGTVNADGFGVGWYPVEPPAGGPDDDRADDRGEDPVDGGYPLPARYRRALPVWADANFTELARTVRSGAVLAAVRSATEGTTQDESASAPFRDGRWLFSHNGAVADWTRLPTTLTSAELLALETHSDSALLWAMTARRLRQGEAPGGALAAVVREVAAARPAARLNLLLTDGRTIAATAWGDTLWYRAGPGAVVVASEPDDALGAGLGTWREVPDRSLLLATPDGVRAITLRPERKDPISMSPLDKSRFTLDDRLPAGYFTDTLHADVRDGLGTRPRTLPPKWFYDKRGSDLFEQITKLPEYYPTRAEQEILVRRAPEIAALTRAATLIELGSGSSRKTRLLLDALTAGGTLRRYAPLDVSASALDEAGRAICRDYPDLTVTATVADFESGLPLSDEPGPRLLAFLGSTIGNFDGPQRAAFYRMLSLTLSSDDVLLLGADLVKDPEVLVRAYDDSAGVTAEFNKNVLHVLDHELGADFEPDAFDHVALWNTDEERMEMRLRSKVAQTVKIPDLDLSLDLAAGEELRTELSCKFRRESLTEELHAGGFTVRQWWTDPAGRFALLLAVPN
jgi:dimethylhistidine N-methyltransferase